MSKKRKEEWEELTPDEQLDYELGRVHYIHLLMRFVRKISEDRVAVYAAQASYYIIMSFIPMLFLMLTFLKYTPLTEEMILELLSVILNNDQMNSLRVLLSQVYHGSIKFFSFAAISLFWVSGTGIMGLTKGLNSIFSVKENRNYLILRLRSSLYAVFVLVAVIISLGALVLSFRYSVFISGILPFYRTGSYVSAVLLTFAAMLVLTLIFNLLYFLLPNRKCRFRSQIYGAVFATLSWGVFSMFFSIYLSVAKNINILYGGLLTIIMAFFWLYSCMMLFFLGGELNAWMENPDSFPF